MMPPGRWCGPLNSPIGDRPSGKRSLIAGQFVAVGGSALVAGFLLLAGHRWGVPAAFAAGAIQVGWIVGEILLVGTHGAVMLAMQATWLATGLALAAVSARLWSQTGAGSAI